MMPCLQILMYSAFMIIFSLHPTPYEVCSCNNVVK